MFINNNPSYYRAHQYRNQFDLPNSAFRNRELQPSASSIPQGREYFQPSSKRHFANVFNRSQIEDDNVMQYEQVRVAFQPTYFRSLNVGDIEGTRPNTLISKAVKNRQKAEMLMKKQSQQVNHQNNNQPLSLYGNQSHLVKQQSRHGQYNHSQESYSQGKVLLKDKQTSDAENKFKKSRSILENSSFNILSNFSSGVKENNDYQPQRINLKTLGHDDNVLGRQEGVEGNFHFRGLGRVVGAINLQKDGGFKVGEDQIAQRTRKGHKLKQERVYEIQNQLGKNLHLINDKIDRNDEFAKNINSEREKTLNNQDFTLPSRRSDPPLNNQNYGSSHQQTILSRNLTVQQPSVKSSSRVDDFSLSHQKASRMQTQAQNPLIFMSKVSNTPAIDKSNIRMFNPTFLSYQSQAIVRNNK